MKVSKKPSKIYALWGKCKKCITEQNKKIYMKENPIEQYSEVVYVMFLSNEQNTF